MFTGIIEDIGNVEQNSGNKLIIFAPKIASSTTHGQSVAVNGVCLTIVETNGQNMIFDIMESTSKVSGTTRFKHGDKVNLERAARLDSFLGGHIVQGHVDGEGKIRQIKKGTHGTTLTIAVEKELVVNMLDKGSVAIDGVSLTIIDVQQGTFSVSLIPTTLQETILGSKKEGDSVNIETDVIGKYVKKHLQGMSGGQGVTEELLKKSGFMD